MTTHAEHDHACCHAPGAAKAAIPAAPAAHAQHAHDAHAHHGHQGHAHHGAHAQTPGGLATAATLHCLTGCAIGELAGLLIGVSLGLGVWQTMALATVLGFASGYTLGLWPLVKQGMTWAGAFKTIWLGETISIAVMEFAMNFTDYHVGGVQAASVLEPRFWLGYALALPAGFIVAWPVNYWLLRNEVKKPCH